VTRSLTIPVRTTESLCTIRHRFRDALENWHCTTGDETYDIVLAISELIANAIIHGQLPIRAQLVLENAETGHEVVFRVSDARPVLVRAINRMDFGRGIQIVRALVDRTGVDSTPGGVEKTVWFTKHIGNVA
jgi:anti-sigma regulatory factor (Ser/Thr protein kinase)